MLLSNRVFAASLVALAACSAKSGAPGSPSASNPSTSEVAVSVVSGAMNNTSGSTVAFAPPRAPKATFAERVVDALNPIGTAYAASWTCQGDSLSPKFAGPGTYEFTPVSCSVTWGNGHTASSTWSGPFTLDYGSSCDKINVFVRNQAGGCVVTRTTGTSSDTRTITGPDGNSYAITHDTNGAGTGWDSSVTPAPANGGVVATCAAGGCRANGGTLVVNGSHLFGTVTIGGTADKIWDHTVSTGSNGMTIVPSPSGPVVSGSVVVEHNILQYTATTTFNSVEYGEPGCCFPTGGSLTTTFSKGPDVGKQESLSFGAVCGEATLTTASGEQVPLELEHCL
jgi:hypothetical protein